MWFLPIDKKLKSPKIKSTVKEYTLLSRVEPLSELTVNAEDFYLKTKDRLWLVTLILEL